MSAHVLLHLLNKLKKYKMKGLPSILSLFHNKFNKFNNTGVWLLDSFYHMTLKLILNHVLHEKHKDFAIYTQRYYCRQYVMFLNL